MIQFKIDKHEALSIHTQLVEQCKFQMESGYWEPGTQLPSVRGLATFLGVNYNTIRIVYQNLERDGYITIEQGRGTFVASQLPGQNERARKILHHLVDEALVKALAHGWSPDEIARTAYMRAKFYQPKSSNIRMLFADCNKADLQHFTATIERSCGTRPEGYLMADLQHYPVEFFAQFDIIATTLFHCASLQKLVTSQQSVLGIKTEPTYEEVLLKIACLPSDTNVGFVCATREGATQIKDAIRDAGLTHIHPLIGGIDQIKEIEKMVETAIPIYVSRHAHSLLESTWFKDVDFNEYTTDIHPVSLFLIHQKIGTIHK